MTTTDGKHEFGTDEWLAQAREELKVKRCYRCAEVGAMSLDWEYHAAGPHSLSGSQIKTSAHRVLIMSHEGCGLRGRITQDTERK